MNNNSAKRNLKTILLTVIITFVVFVIFFGINPIIHLKTNYFSDGGDLIKDIYTTTYHVKYDTSYLHCGAMNYPYGDYYTYDGIVPYISFPLQMLYKMGVTSAPDYINAIMALFVIVSIFLGTIFFYLLFEELGLNSFLSVFAAIAITYLSPQIERIGSHLTLSFLCIYPMMIYYIIRHYKTARYKYCVYYGLVMLFAGLSHAYYLVIFAYISFIYCLFICFKDKQKYHGIRGVITCFVFQMVLPAILFFIICGYGDVPTDRTSIPWGFIEYRGRIEGLLFYNGRPYWWQPKVPVNYETINYMGLVSCVMLLIIIIEMIITVCRGKYKDAFTITDNPVLNIMFYATLLLTIICCAFPVWFGESILKYIGPLAQMRAVGRFLILPYYVMNVISVYLIFNYSKKIGWKYITVMIMAVTVGLYVFDVNRNRKDYKIKYNNSVSKLSDVNNELDINQWVNEIDCKRYQAILPLPFTHVGSEHIWLNYNRKKFFEFMYVSLKTGLPMMSNNTSRTSISDTYKNVSISMIPIVDYPFLDDLPNDKPLLVVVTDTMSLKANDKRILSHAEFLTETNKFQLYSLDNKSLYKICADFRSELCDKVNEIEQQDDFYIENWDTVGGCLSCRLDEMTVVYDGNIPTNTTTFEVSFWVSDYLEDLYSRSSMRIYEVNKDGHKAEIKSCQLFRNNIAVYNGWGLIEIAVNTSGNNKRIIITLENPYKPHKIMRIDNLVIKPNDAHVVVQNIEGVFYDNIPVIGCDPD